MYRKILVPTDGTELSLNAVREACGLARSVGAELLVLHVRSPIDAPRHIEGGALSRLPESTVMEEVEEEERAVLESAMRMATDAHVGAKTAFISAYSVYETIIRIAKEEQCDLVVMSSHGRRGLAGLLLGSETQKLLTHATTPVLVVR